MPNPVISGARTCLRAGYENFRNTLYQGSPFVTPDPTNQNWTLTLPVTPGAVTNAPVSPDAVALWPGASGAGDLDFDQRGFGYSRRAGRAMDVGAFEFQASSVPLRFVEIEPASAGMRLQLQGVTSVVSQN